MPQHTLKKPLTLGDLTVTTLDLPEKADVEAWMVLEPREHAAANNQSTILAILAALTKQPYTLIRKLSVDDMNAVEPMVEDILGNATT